MEKQPYKLQLSDWIPWFGLNDYSERTDEFDNQDFHKIANRGRLLFAYNVIAVGAILSGGAYGILKGIEALVK